MEEKHTWLYDAAGLPTQLTIIKNKTDTTLVTFVKDDAGNIGEERWQKKGRRIETYFYYYNAKKQMTDVVRNNLKAQRMLPDFLFEYDQAGHVVQAVQVLQGSSDYIIWQYLYDDTGLNKKISCATNKKNCWVLFNIRTGNSTLLTIFPLPQVQTGIRAVRAPAHRQLYHPLPHSFLISVVQFV